MIIYVFFFFSSLYLHLCIFTNIYSLKLKNTAEKLFLQLWRFKCRSYSITSSTPVDGAVSPEVLTKTLLFLLPWLQTAAIGSFFTTFRCVLHLKTETETIKSHKQPEQKASKCRTANVSGAVVSVSISWWVIDTWCRGRCVGRALSPWQEVEVMFRISPLTGWCRNKSSVSMETVAVWWPVFVNSPLLNFSCVGLTEAFISRWRSGSAHRHRVFKRKS